MSSLQSPAGLLALPAGISLPYRGGTVPAGALLEYGQNVSRTTYAALFVAIGTTYGSGDGSTTFTLPDSRGRVDVGKDNMGGSAANRITSGNSGITGTTLGAAGGDERMHGHLHSSVVSAGSSAAASDQVPVPTAGNTGTTGAGAAQNVQPSLIANKMITTGGV